jgi:predicted O-methyltransferase YrrM
MAYKSFEETRQALDALDWTKLAIKPKEARAFAREIRSNKVKSAMEIGVASGTSSAVIMSLMAEQTDDPRLYAFDLSATCYFDKSERPKKTGAAFAEVHGHEDGFHLTTGVTAADIQFDKEAEFLFVDANHDTPWAALDVMSLCRYLKPGSMIALHDTIMILRKQVVDQHYGLKKNGSRDIWRAWQGEHHCWDYAPNLGFMRFEGSQMAMESVIYSLGNSWDTKLSEEQAEKFKEIGKELFPPLYDNLCRIIDHRNSERGALVRVPKRKRAAAQERGEAVEEAAEAD